MIVDASGKHCSRCGVVVPPYMHTCSGMVYAGDAPSLDVWSPPPTVEAEELKALRARLAVQLRTLAAVAVGRIPAQNTGGADVSGKAEVLEKLEKAADLAEIVFCAAAIEAEAATTRRRIATEVLLKTRRAYLTAKWAVE